MVTNGKRQAQPLQGRKRAGSKLMKVRYGSLAAVAGILGAVTLPAGALGLGEIEVLSHLNEPLRARIEVRDFPESDWSLLQARIVLDGRAVLAPQVLEQLTVHLVRSGGRRYIEIHSTNPITEPAFDLPVEVSGPGARVLRACAVLLDPAAFESDAQMAAQDAAGEAAQPMAAAASAVGNDTSQALAPAGTQTAPRTAAEAAHPPGLRGRPVRHALGSTGSEAAVARSYTVRSGDTLGGIVARLGVHGERHRGQVMHWIYAHNPAAFYGGMHRLHSGAHLVLPAETSGALAARAAAPAVAPVPKLTATVGAAGGERVPTSPPRAADALLEQRLAELQSSIAHMQETISIQNAQILGLTRQLQRRQEASAAAGQGAVARPAQSGQGRSGGRLVATLLVLLGAAALAVRILRRRRPLQAPVRDAGLVRTPSAVNPEPTLGTLAWSATPLPIPAAAAPSGAAAEAGHAAAPAVGPGAASPAVSDPAAPAQATQPIPAGVMTAAAVPDAAEESATLELPQEVELPSSERRPQREPARPAVHPVQASGADDIWTALYGAETWRDRENEARPGAGSPEETLPMVSFEGLTTLIAQTLEPTAPKPTLVHSEPPPASESVADAVSRERPRRRGGCSGASATTPISAAAAARLRRAQAQFEVTEERSLETAELKSLLAAAIKRDPKRIEMALQLLEIYHREAMRQEFEALAAELLDPARKLSAEQRAQVEALQRSYEAERSGASLAETGETQPMAKMGR